MRYIVWAVEDGDWFRIGGCEDSVEASFLARDEYIENPATEATLVTDSSDRGIIYVIDRHTGKSGSVARRDCKPVLSVNEAVGLTR